MDFSKKVEKNEEMWKIYIREEEHHPWIKDKFDRFTYYLSKNREIFKPVVSEYLYQEDNFRPFWPENYEYAICLTHDIDKVFPERISFLFPAFSKIADKLLKKYVHIPIVYRNEITGRWARIFRIMDLEEKYGAKSSFYFLALEKGDQDFSYSLKDIRETLKYITQSGWEIGLHGGHEAYKNLEKLLEEKKRLEDILGEEVIGYRNHYLRFRVPQTWEILEKAGFKYDTTFGYADCVGFRNGMAYPFRPYNLMKKGIVKILEIPLVIMDRTLFSYMRLDFKSSWKVVERLIDNTRRVKGVITILWHNIYMKHEFEELYLKILEYGKSTNAWMTSCKEIYKWWIGNIEGEESKVDK